MLSLATQRLAVFYEMWWERNTGWITVRGKAEGKKEVRGNGIFASVSCLHNVTSSIQCVTFASMATSFMPSNLAWKMVVTDRQWERRRRGVTGQTSCMCLYVFVCVCRCVSEMHAWGIGEYESNLISFGTWRDEEPWWELWITTN